MKISAAEHTKLVALFEALRGDRADWLTQWSELSDYFLPTRYVWLQNVKGRNRRPSKTRFILDPTGTHAARTLASGMMNGITSPSRPWFRYRIPGVDDENDYEVAQWLDDVERVIALVLAESNFYNAMAVMYLDLVVFGTAAMLIYEDYDSVIRCYNPCLGEYMVGQNYQLKVDRFAREFNQTVSQIVDRFGLENCTDQIKTDYSESGGRLNNGYQIKHLIQPNSGKYGVPKKFEFEECYWVQGAALGEVLEARGFYQIPGIFPRWDPAGNDSYGSPPCLDALGDVIQLQQETMRKGQGLDLMVRPPLLADIQLQNRPSALIPGGVTYIAGINNAGAKPVWETQLPIAELSADIQNIQIRIRETLHNPLFNMISQLETVRSAAEIDARKEEKLVLLGPVLERFENEALDPALARVFNIALRAGLLPPAPQSLHGKPIEIQYVSILSVAQRALATAPMERFAQMVGSLAAITPEVLNNFNAPNFLRRYGRAIDVPTDVMNDPKVVEQLKAQQAQVMQAREAANQGQALVGAGKTLSETDVGGGVNALQALMAQGGVQ